MLATACALCTHFRLVSRLQLCRYVHPYPPAGVYLQINGTRVPNHGFVGRGELRVSNRNRSIDNPLLCVTPDNTNCCSSAETGGGALLGNWYFPNGTEVPPDSTGWNFYITKGPGVVRLHRRTGGVSGIYRCEIPDQSGINQILYVGLYAISSITSGKQNDISLPVPWSPESRPTVDNKPTPLFWMTFCFSLESTPTYLSRSIYAVTLSKKQQAALCKGRD